MSKFLFEDFDEVSAKQWKQKIQYDLKGADYNETLVWKSPEGINVKPFYHEDDFKEDFQPIPGQPPDLAELGEGCPFAPRCHYASEVCRKEQVTLREVAPGHHSACHFPDRVGQHE